MAICHLFQLSSSEEFIFAFGDSTVRDLEDRQCYSEFEPELVFWSQCEFFPGATVHTFFYEC